MTANAAPFPWEEAMAIGLHRLRLSPDAFWRMTPREFAAALGPRRAGAPSLEGLRGLMAAFPDDQT